MKGSWMDEQHTGTIDRADSGKIGGFSRRSFLRGSLSLGAGSALLALVACAPPASETPTTVPAAAPTSPPPTPAPATKPSAAPAGATPKAATSPAAGRVSATPAATAAAAGATSNFTTKVDVDKAKKEGTVSFYTSLDPQILDAIIKPFTAQYGIAVKYYRAGSADISGKVLAEADAGRVQADVVDASDVGAFLAMKQRGLLAPYESPYAQSIAKNLRDPENLWVADRLTQGVIQWNTQLVTGSNVPHHWQDLTDPKWNGKLCSFNSAGDAAPRLYTLAQHFDWSLLEKIAATKPLIQQTVQLNTQTVETGERQAAYAQNDNIAWRSKLQKKPTDYVLPDEGVPTEPGAVGLIKNALHPTAAMLWYDWWMSDTGQKILVEGGKYSSRADLEPPSGSIPLSKLKLLTLDYADYQAHRKEITDRMAKIFGGVW
jgi:iron(III) transport system substrate-binding protein